MSFHPRVLPVLRLLPPFLILAAAVSVALPKGGPPPRLVAGATCVKGESKQDTASAEAAGVVFEARPLAVSEWEARLERAAAGMGPALRKHDGSEGPFQVFLLTLRNRTSSVVRFQPGNVVRILGDTDQDHILDYTDLYRYLGEEEKNPDSLDRIKDAYFDAGLSLDHGESVERLLFFRPLPPKTKLKQLTLLISSFQVGTETYRASLPWHFEKEKK